MTIEISPFQRLLFGNYNDNRAIQRLNIERHELKLISTRSLDH